MASAFFCTESSVQQSYYESELELFTVSWLVHQLHYYVTVFEKTDHSM